MRLQIVPDYEIDNKKIVGLLENIHFYRSPLQRFRVTKDQEYLNIDMEQQHIISYEILIKRDSVDFYIGFDDRLKDNIYTELNIVWPRATFTDAAPLCISGTTKELELKEHYFLSLKTDLRAEYPISHILESQNILRDQEAILIRLELTPVSYSWYREAEECVKSFNQGKMPTKNILDTKELAVSILDSGINTIYSGLNFINSFFSDIPIEHEKIKFDQYSKLLRDGLSENTKDKSKYNGYDTRILITTANTERSGILFRNMLKSFNTMAQDNSFILVDHSEYKNILSSRELAQMFQMPTKHYQKTYRINHIDNREIEIAQELLQPGILIGSATYKGKEYNTYYSNNINVRALPKILIGPQNAGKTSATANFIVNAHKVGDACIVIDYIQNCELSKLIEKHIPRKELEIIDVSDMSKVFPLAYTESFRSLRNNSSTWERKRVANLNAAQLEYLFNSVQGTNIEDLTPRMQRFLYAAAMVVFIHADKTIGDVIYCLKDYRIRNEYIRLAKYSKCFREDDEIFLDIDELHRRDEKTNKIIGTREDLVRGIYDRITILKKNIYISEMLAAPIDHGQDLINFIEQKKTVLIRIPQNIFPDVHIRDTIATYFLSRIWLAVQLREDILNDTLCHIAIDEVFQIQTCAAFMKNHINEFRRHRLAPYFTVHYLKQFGKLLDAVKSSGASYHILAGTERENIMMLDPEIKPFTIEEAMNLKPYHSLNIVNIGNEYARFISKLPRPL